MEDGGVEIVGLDNISGYYDISLKISRLKQLGVDEHAIAEGEKTTSASHTNFAFIKADIKDKHLVNDLFKAEQFNIIVNLAAQAGVRYSVENPQVYIDANIQGFINILEACRHYPVEHLVYASSSSVYGANETIPFSVKDKVDRPLSLYAATKKSNELMAHTYSHLFKIPTTGLRFFTVYGPWGRPDMALFLFANAMTSGKPIKVFNNGDMARDFTYIDDIVEGVKNVMKKAPDADKSLPYKVYNIGRNEPVKLMDFIALLEKEFGIEAKKEFLPLQPGDVEQTFADVSELARDLGFKPTTDIETGIKRFVEWYREFYNIKKTQEFDK